MSRIGNIVVERIFISDHQQAVQGVVVWCLYEYKIGGYDDY
jgi:hypothetical protein